MEFHINRSPDNSFNSSSDSSMANDRLRKAIERNRAKQARRQGTGAATRQTATVRGTESRIPNDWRSPGAGTPSSASTMRTAPSSNFEATQNRFNNLNTSRASSTPSHARRNVTVGGSSSTPNSSLNRMNTTTANTTVGTRRTVAGLNQEQQIIETPKRKRKSAAAVNYSTPKKKTRKKKSAAANSNIQLLVKGAWVLCLVLFVRLIFTDGGIIDYYSTRNLLKLKSEEATSIKNENLSLVDEIDRIKNDRSYQKKLVRDNLGFIARNEYLVLFPKTEID